MRAEILKMDDLQTKSVHVKEWDRLVRIRELDLATGISIFEKALSDTVVMTAEDIAAVVVYGVIDEKGDPVFGKKDIKTLAHKSRNAMMMLYREIQNLSGSTQDAEKNSEASQR